MSAAVCDFVPCIVCFTAGERRLDGLDRPERLSDGAQESCCSQKRLFGREVEPPRIDVDGLADRQGSIC